MDQSDEDAPDNFTGNADETKEEEGEDFGYAVPEDIDDLDLPEYIDETLNPIGDWNDINDDSIIAP